MKSIKLNQEVENGLYAPIDGYWNEFFQIEDHYPYYQDKEKNYFIGSDTTKSLQSQLRDFSLCFACLQDVFSAEDPKAAFEKFRKDFFGLLPVRSQPFPPHVFVSVEDFSEWKHRLDSAHLKLAARWRHYRMAIFRNVFNYFKQADTDIQEHLQTQAKERLERIAPHLTPETLQVCTDFIENLFIEEIDIVKPSGAKLKLFSI